MCFSNTGELVEYVKSGAPNRDMPFGSPEWQAKQAEAGPKPQQGGSVTPPPKKPDDAAAAGGATPTGGDASRSDPTGFAALSIPRTSLPGSRKNVASG